MATTPYATPKNQWDNIIFFAVTTLVALIGTPLYVYRYGLAASEIALLVFFLVATPLSITVGYHRLFAHGAYKTNAVIRFLLLFFGAAAFEQSVLEWSSQHRDHHRYVDTDRDPYSIKKGFFYAHMGWMVFWHHETDYDNVQSLSADPMVMHQHRHYVLWAILAGIGMPLLLGALSGHLLGAFILSVCLRLTVVYHLTFFINSICHMFGRATYDIYATARDNWFIALLTFGEGYHNFHHRFAADYRNGVRWYQWDPSKWIIALMEKTGLAWDLRRVSSFSILAAQLAGENKRVSDWFTRVGKSADLPKLHRAVMAHYASLRQNLAKWEDAAKEYGDVLQRQVAQRSEEVLTSARRKLAEAHEQFKFAHQEWKGLLKQCPVPA
ncbi:MAG TPA: acyl-CoA desaturase [Gammaproteobacteria bacterium]